MLLDISSNFGTCSFFSLSLCICSLPLVQSKQKFAAMEVHYRENLKQNIDDSAKKFQLDDMTYGSFIAQFGYKTKVSTCV